MLWTCNDPRCNADFKTLDLFENHMRQTHQGVFSERQLPAIAEMCKRTTEPPFRCPLCLQPSDSSNELCRHVGEEMEELALFVLSSQESDVPMDGSRAVEVTSTASSSLLPQRSQQDDTPEKPRTPEPALETDLSASVDSLKSMSFSSESSADDTDTNWASPLQQDEALIKVKRSFQLVQELVRSTKARSSELTRCLMRLDEHLRAYVLQGDRHMTWVEDLKIVMQEDKHTASMEAATHDLILCEAASKGMMLVVELIIRQDITTEKETFYHAIALHAAATGRQYSTAKILEEGAAVNRKDERGLTALHLAAYYGHIPLMILLLEGNANASAKGEDGNTALHYAAAKEVDDAAQTWVRRSANITAKADFSNTASRNAFHNGQVEMVELLVQQGGADISAPNVDGDTALHFASRHGNSPIAETLLKGGANPIATSSSGATPLHMAASAGKLETIRTLLSHGARVTARDKRGRSPLYEAAASPGTTSMECARALLEHGADIGATNSKGETALECAKKAGNAPVARLLEEYTMLSSLTETMHSSHPGRLQGIDENSVYPAFPTHPSANSGLREPHRTPMRTHRNWHGLEVTVIPPLPMRYPLNRSQDESPNVFEVDQSDSRIVTSSNNPPGFPLKGKTEEEEGDSARDSPVGESKKMGLKDQKNHLYRVIDLFSVSFYACRAPIYPVPLCFSVTSSSADNNF